MWPSLETTPKTITVAGNFVFITLGTLNRPDLHFEGAGNGPVVITWISRKHELYSGASPISVVEHCVSHQKTWTWLRKGNLKREMESLLIAAQDNAIRTNHIKVRIDKIQQNSICRLCGDRDETINHIISECSKLAQKEYSFCANLLHSRDTIGSAR